MRQGGCKQELLNSKPQLHESTMGKTAGALALLGFWMLVAGLGESFSMDSTDSLYIVQVDHNTLTSSVGYLEMTTSRYSQMLQSVRRKDSNDVPTAHLVHVYHNIFHGFSARLTFQEAEALKNMDGVLGVYPDTVRHLHTTHTPEFLGLSSTEGLWPESNFGDDVIVGVLDSGVWPEGESFSDKGLGPVPSRWKGSCQSGPDFNVSLCNNKIIGARYFSAGYEAATGPMNDTIESRSPRDTEGHGTHTASTAAGSPVEKASLNELAEGTARGMASKARIAVYKICWERGCYDSDIAAAFDQAVADGVDVISLSVGGGVVPYYQDSIAIGAFGAMKKGIFVSCSAGNSGPGRMTVSNIAPWVVTVAASTLDRKFPAGVELGNNQTISGVSLYRGSASDEEFTGLVYGGDVASTNVTYGSQCLEGSLDPSLVKGKIVLCDRGGNGRVAKGAVVMGAGGFGMILTNTPVDGEGLLADSHILPATLVGATGGATIKSYIKSSNSPVAKFKFGGTQLDVKPAPVVASFSSRGPNSLTPKVLKPDITGPGVNILAAWTGRVGPSGLAFDNRRVKFNIISGTSMSCPHISGLGALLRGAHPTWSPSAIKSAIMTTATVLDNKNSILTDEATTTEATPFHFGSGHVQPERALKPGLVYDMSPQDYVNFLCAVGYSPKRIQIFTNEPVTCPRTAVRVEDMNYPSFSAVLKHSSSTPTLTTNFTRTVTNVGFANSTYSASIISPDDITVTVKPEQLTFSAEGEKQSFTLVVSATSNPISTVVGASETKFAFLVWTDGSHVVQSPIAITVE